MTTDNTGEPVFWWLDNYLRNESHVQKNLEFLLWKSVTAVYCHQRGVQREYNSQTFTIHKCGYGTAYTFTHNMNMLEHIAINGTNTTKHTDAYNAQF